MTDSKETELKPCPCAKHNCEAVAMESQNLDGDWRYWVTCKHIIEPCNSGLSASKGQIHELWNLRQEVTRTPGTTQLLKDKGELMDALEFTVGYMGRNLGNYHKPIGLKDARALLDRLSPQKQEEQS